MKKILAAIALFLVVLPAFSSGVKTASYSKETPIKDFDGKNIAVQTAVLYEELIMDTVPNATFQYYTMPNDMIQALKSGKVDAYLVEGVGYGVQKANHPELDTLDELPGVIEAACIVGNNSRKDTIMRELNEFIASYYADGSFDRMYDYWINNFDPETSTFDVPVYTGEKGKLSVAVEGGYEPFSFVSNGRLSGFDVEFVCLFCAKYGYEPVFYEVPFEAIAPGVETGKYDLGMNIILSDERDESGNLTDVYYSCPVVLVILGEGGDGLNFFEKLENSFYKTFIRENRWKLFLEGAGVTVLITVCSILAGTFLGFCIYMICRHGNPIANKINDFFNWLIEGMPTVLFIMIFYYIIFGSSSLSGMWVSVVGFSLIFACSMYDMLVVGCNAVPEGQLEAAKALGYTDGQSFFKILLPQAAQHFLPIYKNDVVTLIKETSIVGYIAVLDLTKISDLVRSRTYEAFFPLIATAIMYFIISAVMTSIVKHVQIRVNPKRRSEDKILEGIKQWD